MTFPVARGALSIALLGLLLACASPPGWADARAKGDAAERRVTEESVFGRNLPDPDHAGMLPDSFVVARVGSTVIRAGEVALAYSNAYAETRPSNDSLGRVGFLQSMIQKELLAAEAKRVNPPLTFEDRNVLREYSNAVYSRMLFQRAVTDSVHVTDEDVRRAYELYRYNVRVRRILFSSREVGERVRRDLLSGRIGWSSAVRRYSYADRTNDGDLGWQNPGEIGLDFAEHTHVLQPGQYSDLFQSRDGWELFQCVERQEARAPSLSALSTLIRGQLESVYSGRRAGALQDMLGERIGFQIDTTNVRWAASKFQAVSSVEMDAGTPVMNFNAAVPELTTEESERVLARFKGGEVTLGEFVHAYSEIQPVLRPNVNDFWLLKTQVLTTALQPYMVQLAIERGIDKDPESVRYIERKREQLLVEHLYQDSVAFRVSVTPTELERYYEEHKPQFFSFVRVKFAAITRPTQAGIDSVAARIRGGESPQSILQADSLAGRISGSIQERSESEQGAPFQRILFEELRAGQHTVVGPDREGHYMVIAVLERHEGRQLSYDEVRTMVDEGVRDLKAEELLDRILLRVARQVGVDWRPDLVMRIEWNRLS